MWGLLCILKSEKDYAIGGSYIIVWNYLKKTNRILTKSKTRLVIGFFLKRMLLIPHANLPWNFSSVRPLFEVVVRLIIHCYLYMLSVYLWCYQMHVGSVRVGDSNVFALCFMPALEHL